MTCEKYKVVGSFNESKKYDFEGRQKAIDHERRKSQLCPSQITRLSKDPERDIKILKKRWGAKKGK